MDQARVRLAVCLGAGGLILGCLACLPACSPGGQGDHPQFAQTVRLAATFSAGDSGLLDTILPVFEDETGLTVQVSILASGAAIDAAMQGHADVVLTHDRNAENTFMKAGYGLNRRDVMSNEFVLLGPPSDPAGIVGARNLVDALNAIREGGHRFVSRGDRSGTHTRELDLWRLAGGDPAGEWYEASGSGMLSTLRRASAAGAYVLADRSTYLQHEGELDLVVAVSNDSRLVITYGAIAVNPAMIPGANYPGAMALIEFLVSPQGQQLIGEYGADRFGSGLFVPIAAR
jgi:tungstate transport system substrate-binding protein